MIFTFTSKPKLLLGRCGGMQGVVAPFLVLDIILLWQSGTGFGAFGWVTLHFVISIFLSVIYFVFSVWKILVVKSIKWKIIDFISLLVGELVLLSPYLFVNSWFKLAMSWFPNE